MTINRIISNQGNNVYGTAQGIRRLAPATGKPDYDDQGIGTANYGVQNLQGLWDPTVINVQSWWDPSDPTKVVITSAGTFTGITDKGTNGFTLDNVNDTANTGTQTLNGYNVIELEAGDWFRASDTDITNTSGNLVIAVLARIDTVDNATDGLFAWNDDVDFQFDANNATRFNGRLNATGAGIDDINLTGGPFDDGSWHLFMSVSDFTNTTNTIYVDGVSRGTGAYGTKWSNTGALDFRMFANRGGGQQPTGLMAESVLYENCTETCRQEVEGYLMNKYGINSQLPSDHPYRNKGPVA
jgi:hypothetical protein